MSSETVTVAFRREVAETIWDHLPMDLGHLDGGWEQYEAWLVEGWEALDAALNRPAPVNEEGNNAA